MYSHLVFFFLTPDSFFLDDFSDFFVSEVEAATEEHTWVNKLSKELLLAKLVHETSFHRNGSSHLPSHGHIHITHRRSRLELP